MSDPLKIKLIREAQLESLTLEENGTGCPSRKSSRDLRDIIICFAAFLFLNVVLNWLTLFFIYQQAMTSDEKIDRLEAQLKNLSALFNSIDDRGHLNETMQRITMEVSSNVNATAKKFYTLEGSLEELSEKFNSVNSRVNRLDNTTLELDLNMRTSNEKFDKLDNTAAQLNSSLERFGVEIETVNQNVRQLESKLETSNERIIKMDEHISSGLAKIGIFEHRAGQLNSTVQLCIERFGNYETKSNQQVLSFNETLDKLKQETDRIMSVLENSNKQIYSHDNHILEVNGKLEAQKERINFLLGKVKKPRYSTKKVDKPSNL